ncbi:hypothetical protein CSC3H3_02070 [Thalassospira marina]|uniref:Uncharacterized protein n=1 Tax=Thalassospira marina TaxID=2048283 RepID=A0ABM6Q579_9PROT|nr:hypothetical protein CSC3H3_02070 [Thalassospira marina]
MFRGRINPAPKRPSDSIKKRGNRAFFLGLRLTLALYSLKHPSPEVIHTMTPPVLEFSSTGQIFFVRTRWKHQQTDGIWDV